MRIGFVILHYQDEEMTNKCVDSILNLDDELFEKQIVVVDNCSPNKSGYRLSERYTQTFIKVLINNENIGFAKGNNVGYKLCKNILCDVIIVMNNDVLIKQKNFLKYLNELIVNEPDVAVFAPDVLNRDNIHCNPMSIPPITVKSMNKIWWDSFVRLFFYSIPILNRALVKRHQNTTYIAGNKLGYNKQQINIIPHGCCVIFNKKWIEKEDFAFVPITYMYAEEHILYEYCAYHNYKILYSPKIQILHYEAVTTNPHIDNNDYKKAIKSRKMYMKWHMDAVRNYYSFCGELKKSNSKRHNTGEVTKLCDFTKNIS